MLFYAAPVHELPIVLLAMHEGCHLQFVSPASFPMPARSKQSSILSYPDVVSFRKLACPFFGNLVKLPTMILELVGDASFDRIVRLRL